jgi:hypothetical protein
LDYDASVILSRRAAWLTLAFALTPCVGCNPIGAKSPLAGQTRLPAFPQPIPEPHGSTPIDTAAVEADEEGAEDKGTLGSTQRWLVRVLEDGGFTRWSVYAFGDGFALVTQWERIEGAKPTKDRFVARHPKRMKTDFDFDDHTQLLFNAPDGDYRLFVITVTGAGGEASEDVPIDGDAVAAGALPDELARVVAGERVIETHVYVYNQRGSGKASPTESETDVAGHIEAAGLVL